jgi:hypothetical protein
MIPHLKTTLILIHYNSGTQMKPKAIVFLILISVVILTTLICINTTTINETSQTSINMSADNEKSNLMPAFNINAKKSPKNVGNYDIKANTMEESKFNQRCLDKLNIEISDFSYENISNNHQRKIATLLSGCIYEIDMELALTERSITRNTQNQPCFNKIYEIRDSLLELDTDAQFFGELPNSTDADRVKIASDFKRISDNIIKSGKSAMNNRTDLCMK